jgi:N-acyl homoserine lactone hydrolase
MTTDLNVHAITTGFVQIKARQMHSPVASRAVRLIGLFADRDWSDWLPIHAWLIEHPEGLIVVDTGESGHPTPGLPHPYAALNVRFRVQPEDEIGLQLERLGFKPRDVRHVVMTHLHTDHDGGIKYFPNAEFIVAPNEYAEARGFMGRLRGYVPQRWPKDWEPKLVNLKPQPFGPFAQSHRLTRAGDVVIVSTPGHTAQHRSVIVQDGETSLFLAGDTSYTQQAMLQGWVDGVGPDAHVEQDTLERIRRFALERPTVYLPTHDPESSVRLEARQAVPRASK